VSRRSSSCRRVALSQPGHPIGIGGRHNDLPAAVAVPDGNPVSPRSDGKCTSRDIAHPFKIGCLPLEGMIRVLPLTHGALAAISAKAGNPNLLRTTLGEKPP